MRPIALIASLLLGAAPAVAGPIDLSLAPVVDLDPITLDRDAVDPGDLDAGDASMIRLWVEARRGVILRCVPAVGRPMPLRLVIAPDGGVSAEAWTGDAQADRCIAESLQPFRFAPRGQKPITWIGRIDFGHPALRIYGVSTRVRVPPAVMRSDALAADGPTAPPLPTPRVEGRPWSPEPEWAASLRAAPEVGHQACAGALGRAADRVRVVALWRGRSPERVHVPSQGDPAYARCVAEGFTAAQRTGTDAPMITTHTQGDVQPLGGGRVRVIPGRAIGPDPVGVVWLGAFRRRLPWSAITACYRARLIERPALAGEALFGLHMRQRPPFDEPDALFGVVETRVTVLSDAIGDEALNDCVAAALETIRPHGSTLPFDARPGLRIRLRFVFETGPAEPLVHVPSTTPLESWLVARGTAADSSALVDRARQAGQRPHMSAARAAAGVGRYPMARALYTEAREGAVAAGDFAVALQAQLGIVDTRRSGDHRHDLERMLADVTWAVELDAARIAAGGEPFDPRSDALDRLILDLASAFSTWYSSGRLRVGDRADRSLAWMAWAAFELWRVRSDTGARRRPPGERFRGDADALFVLALASRSFGPPRLRLALYDRHRALFPDDETAARALEDRQALAEFIARDLGGCRLNGRMVHADGDPPGGAPDRPCPRWLQAPDPAPTP